MMRPPCDDCGHTAHGGFTCAENLCPCDKGDAETCDTCGRRVDDHDMRSFSDPCQQT